MDSQLFHVEASGFSIERHETEEGGIISMSLSLEGATTFQRKVLELLMNIPKGRVTTYREIAKALGNIHSTRAVGNAVRDNPYPVKIPCHRVIRSSGEIGGFGGELAGENVARKIKLLMEEGVHVDNTGRIDLQKYLVKAEDLTGAQRRVS
jgi:methylated-DNA-[protein]-cysteine S-methyltransferase